MSAESSLSDLTESDVASMVSDHQSYFESHCSEEPEGDLDEQTDDADADADAMQENWVMHGVTITGTCDEAHGWEFKELLGQGRAQMQVHMRGPARGADRRRPSRLSQDAGDVQGHVTAPQKPPAPPQPLVCTTIP